MNFQLPLDVAFHLGLLTTSSFLLVRGGYLAALRTGERITVTSYVTILLKVDLYGYDSVHKKTAFANAFVLVHWCVNVLSNRKFMTASKSSLKRHHHENLLHPVRDHRGPVKVRQCARKTKLITNNNCRPLRCVVRFWPSLKRPDQPLSKVHKRTCHRLNDVEPLHGKCYFNGNSCDLCKITAIWIKWDHPGEGLIPVKPRELHKIWTGFFWMLALESSVNRSFPQKLYSIRWDLRNGDDGAPQKSHRLLDGNHSAPKTKINGILRL